LWRKLNIDISRRNRIKRSQIPTPLPPTVTINPLTHTIWNSFKGGGDTITKLIDNVQERLGIRSDSNAASARLLVYFAIAFHRGNQWCHAKEDLTFYPTLAHARHANNERAAMHDMLQAASTMLKSQASAAALETPTAGLDGVAGQTIQLESLAIPETSEDNGRRRKTRKSMNATPDPVQMPIIGFKTGRTPAHRNKADVDKFFQERCDNCLGMFYGQVVPDPDIRSTTKDNRIRRKCYFCDSRTDMFCFKCRRWLCFSRPLKKDKKQPKYFTVNTPVLDRLGKLQPTQEDSELEYESAKEVGIWTCYHAAHIKGWTKHAQSAQGGMLNAAGVCPRVQPSRASQRQTRAVSASRSTPRVSLGVHGS